jgi:hypothetical protein
MVMFLLVACTALFGLAVTALAFGAATREAGLPERRLEPTLPLAPSRFFVNPAGAADLAGMGTSPLSDTRVPLESDTRVPIEVLLLRLERHVRLEQAAAEAFLDLPTVASLHSRTASPLVH